MATIHFSRHGALIKLRPDGFLGPELFAAYRRAVDVARYDRAIKAYTAPVDRVHMLLMKLRDAGFGVDVDSDVHHELLAFNASRWNDLQAAEERIQSMDEDLRARSNGTEAVFPHQASGALWLTLRRCGLLADEQGTGKSLTVILAIPPGSPVLIVCPNSMKDIWVQELRRRPQIKASVIDKRAEFHWPEPGEAVIINYEALPKGHGKRPDGSDCDGKLPPEKCPGCLRTDTGIAPGQHLPSCDARKNLLDTHYPCPGCHPFLARVRPHTVFVLDEAHMVRNPSSQRTQSAKAIARACLDHQGRVWPMTGTPIVNTPNELWQLLQVADLTREAFGTYDDFVRIFGGTEKYFGGHEWGEVDSEVVECMRRVSLRRMRRDVLASLPRKLYRSIPVKLDASTLRACEEFLEEQGKSVDEIAALLAAEKFPFQLMSRIRSALALAKIPAMLERVEYYESENEPLGVFSAHRAPILELAKRPGWAVILGGEGGTPQKERAAIVDAFQRGEFKGIGLTIAAGGVGLTLTHAHHVLFVDRGWTPAENAQAEDRFCRIGQEHGVIVETLLGKHPLDERVTEVLIEKTRLITAAVDASSQAEHKPTESFEDELRQIQQEIALGRKVRRQAETKEERDAIRVLHESQFHPRDEAVAVQLAEYALLIGLTDKQWAFALDLARRAGKRKPNIWKRRTEETEDLKRKKRKVG